MLERHGMVLEGRVAVCLGGVTGVPRLGEQAEVRELEPLDEGRRFSKGRSAPDARKSRVDQRGPEERALNGDHEEEDG